MSVCQLATGLLAMQTIDRSFRVTVAQAWNSLPTNVTASTSLPSFKRQLKTFFYQIFPITLNCILVFVYRVLEAYATLISTFYYYYKQTILQQQYRAMISDDLGT